MDLQLQRPERFLEADGPVEDLEPVDHIGDPREGERTLAPIRSWGRPLLDLVDIRPYTQLQALVAAAYGEPTFRRFVAHKDRYDPDNVLRLNHNIPPSGTAVTTDADSRAGASTPRAGDLTA